MKYNIYKIRHIKLKNVVNRSTPNKFSFFFKFTITFFIIKFILCNIYDDLF